jgi:hypothetical protein
MHLMGNWSGHSSTITGSYADTGSRKTLLERGGSIHGFNAVFRAIMSPLPDFIDGIFGGLRFEDLAGRPCTLSQACAAAVQVQISSSLAHGTASCTRCPPDSAFVLVQNMRGAEGAHRASASSALGTLQLLWQVGLTIAQVCKSVCATSMCSSW